MSSDDVKKSVRTPIVIGLAMLIVGLVVGVGAWRFMGRGLLLAQKGDPANGAAGRSASGKTQGQAPDPFFSDQNDPWDPFRKMRSLQAEVNEMFRQSIARFHSSPVMNPFGEDAGYSLSLDVPESLRGQACKAFLNQLRASRAWRT